jgi:hypothetical protein
MSRCFRCFLAAVGLVATAAVHAQLDSDVAAMAERLCKTKGSSMDIRVKFDGSAETGKVIAQVLGVGGKVSGTGEFTRSEWDGIRFTNSPEQYVKCLDLVLSRIKKNG